MSFQSQSLDAKSPSAIRRTAGYRQPTDNFDAEPSPDHDPVWRWLRKAASWLLRLLIDGFAAYGNAMHPCPEMYQAFGTAAAEPKGVDRADRGAVLLSTFSDHMLQDIGVARDQIDAFTDSAYRRHDHDDG